MSGGIALQWMFAFKEANCTMASAVLAQVLVSSGSFEMFPFSLCCGSYAKSFQFCGRDGKEIHGWVVSLKALDSRLQYK